MVKYEDHCCDCATPGYPCRGSECPLRKVAVYYCDVCREKLEEIYDVDGRELCEECLKDEFRRNE